MTIRITGIIRNDLKISGGNYFFYRYLMNLGTRHVHDVRQAHHVHQKKAITRKKEIN
jgi:hypothetical protein